MFLTQTSTTIRGKTYTHYKLVESFREGGRVKHRVLLSLGDLTAEQIQQIRAVLAVTHDTEWISVPFTDIAVTQHAAYLDVAVGHALWEESGWGPFWGPDAFWVEALVLNRLLDPQAKIHLHSWAASTVLPAYYAISPDALDPYAVYRVLDRMATRDAAVQQALVAHHLPPSGDAPAPTFFYDLTSTYVEGTTSPLAKAGYSRDHRPDRTQIVIGLLITATGSPIYWQVWPGNTPDVTTVQTVVKDLAQRLSLGTCVLVFDRGMVSAANLAAIDAAQHVYLSAVDRDALATLPFWATAWPAAVAPDHWQETVKDRHMVPYDPDATLWYREWTVDARRYVVAFDAQRYHLEDTVQAKAVQDIETWMATKNTELAAAKRSRQRETLDRTVQDLLRHKHLTDIVQYHLMSLSIPRGRTTVQSWQIAWSLDSAALRAAQRLFGVTCFQTNAPTDSLATSDIITWYRRKNRVEEAFHEIKSPLALRPLFVTRAQRIRAHVMACVLAYDLYNTMEVRLRQHKHTESPSTVLKALASSQINRLRVKSTDQTRLTITEPTPNQRAYVSALQCDAVLDDRPMQSVVTAMKSWL